MLFKKFKKEEGGKPKKNKKQNPRKFKSTILMPSILI
jgi:hypothetical protein